MAPSEKTLLTRRQLLHNSVVLGMAALVDRAHAQDASLASRSWSIGNQQIARTIVMAAGKGIFTENFADLATGAHFISAGNLRMDMAAEFSFECNGHSYSGTKPEFALLSAEASKIPNGNALTMRLLYRPIGLEVSLVYRSYDGHPAIRKHLVLRNTGTTTLKFTHLHIELLGLAFGPENETILNAQYGAIPREIFYTGRSEDAGLLLSNSRTGDGIAILTEVPGYMKRTEIGGWDDPERVRLGVL